MNPLRLLWGWGKRTIRLRVLHANDSPHRVALGVALGVAISWTPALGLHTVMLIGLALLLRANILAGLPFLWLSNTLTLVPVYAPSYYLGCRLLGRQPTGDFVLDVARTMRITDGLFAKIQAWWHVTEPYAAPLWVGALVMATLLGVVAYAAAHWGVLRYRRRRPHLALPLSGKKQSAEQRPGHDEETPTP